MDLKIKIGFKRLKKLELNLIFQFLEDIDIIAFKNINSFSKQYFKSRLESLRIFRYVLNYNKSSNYLKNGKIHILNLMTNSNFLHRAKSIFKVEENEIVNVCLKLANYYHDKDMRVLENFK